MLARASVYLLVENVYDTNFLREIECSRGERTKFINQLKFQCTTAGNITIKEPYEMSIEHSS